MEGKMRVALLVAVIAASLPSAGSAQQTQCRQTYPGWPEGGVTCNTGRTQPAQPERCAGGDWLIAGCTVGEHRAAKDRAAAAKILEARRKAVGLAIAEGRCDDALKIALTDGDLDLAERIKSLCRAPS
jgi:hypothetical protein